LVDSMELRHHSAMSYRGIANWPPVWTRAREGNVATVRGEVGVLLQVYGACFGARKCYLVIEHASRCYVGCLLFSDAAACMHISSLLRAGIGSTIEEVGGYEVSPSLGRKMAPRLHRGL
jgi:hypothetical protein